MYHSRYNWPEMKKVMTEPSKVVRLASVREPKDLLRSLYNYFYLVRGYNFKRKYNCPEAELSAFGLRST